MHSPFRSTCTSNLTDFEEGLYPKFGEDKLYKCIYNYNYNRYVPLWAVISALYLRYIEKITVHHNIYNGI
jgi:hypothetical protein